MIFWNTPATRDAIRRALATLDQHCEGAVMQLDMVSGDVLLCAIADEPLPEERAFAIRYAT